MSLPINSHSSSINSLNQLHSNHQSNHQAFELSNLVLVTTLDGKLHGLDRNTGKWNWTLNDPSQKTEGLIDLASVQSNHHLHQFNPNDQSEIYAIEPHNDGDLYVLSRSSNSSKLQKLPLSVSQLVNLSPFTFPSDSSKMFVGKKDTNLIGIDLKNGQVVGVLKADINRKPEKGKGRQTCERVDSLLGHQTCHMEDNGQGSSSRYETDEPQTADDIDQRPRDLLYIGRTDYQISIYSKPDTLIQTLRYSTYSPSNLGHSLQSQWTRTPDESYLEPMHDGNLICFQFDRITNNNPADPLQQQDGKIKWQNSFDFPVTNIFDVAFPKSTQDLSKDLSHRPDPSSPSWEHTHSSEDKSPSAQQPVMFVQPRLIPSQGGLSSQTFSSMYEQYNPTKASPPESPHSSTSRPESDPTSHPKKAFLGNFDESFYIMSQDNYPLVSFAPSAQQTLGHNNVIGTHTLLDAGLATHTIGTVHDRRLLLEAGSSAMNGLHYDRGRRRDVPPLALDPAPQPSTISSPESRSGLSKKFSLSSILSSTPPKSSSTLKPPRPVIQQRAAQISSLIVRSFKNQLIQSNGSHEANEHPDDITLSMNPTLAILFFTFVLVWLASKKNRNPHSYRWDVLARRTSSSLPDSITRTKPANLFEYWLGGRENEDLSQSLVVSQKALQDPELNSDSLTDDMVEGSAPSDADTRAGVCGVDSKVEIPDSQTKLSGLAVPSASDQADDITDGIDNDDAEPTENGTLETPKPKSKPKRRRGKRPGQKAAAAAAAAAKAEAEACKAQVDFPVSIVDTTRSLQSHPSMTTIATATPSQPTLRFAQVEDEQPTPTKPKLNLRKKKSNPNSAASLKEPGLSDLNQHTTPKNPVHKPPELDISATPTSFSSLLSPVDSGGFQPHKIGSLMITDETLGYGSHGTVVLKGTFQGRQVAIKRLLKDFVTLATHEVALLQESDDHPNVIRYFVKESLENFLYIALELCNGSLSDLIERKSFNDSEEILENFNPKKALKQITSGLRYLHSLKIVHRDIKPQNILISFTKGPPISHKTSNSKNKSSSNKPFKNPSQRRTVRMLISDFGLCKKLDIDESSFAQTANHGAGSFGYRAPEILKGQVNLNEQTNLTPTSSITSSTINSASNGSNETNGNGSNSHGNRLTRSIDIFSLGCIFYYVLTRGEHPFGSRYEREVNILKGEMGLEQLDGFDEEAFEAQYLIRSMLRSNPKERPTAEQVLQNPYFWDPTKRLMFLCESSDRFEILDRESDESKTQEILNRLEDLKIFYNYLPTNLSNQIQLNWDKRVDKVLIENLGKYRRYDFGSIRDLLRVLRNKKHHFQDLPENLKRTLGNLPEGFLNYFTKRFPSLIIHVYLIIDQFFSHESMFYNYFLKSDQLDDL
ncbi:IRE protein kinase [Melampsora americana]|nr:IRE protein kinase [Melampsora americana]